MLLTLTGHSFRYECENLCRLFFPYSPVRVEQGEPAANEPWAEAVLTGQADSYEYRVRVSDGAKVLERTENAAKLSEYTMTALLYHSFVELTGCRPTWGMLTGIHPVKLLREYTETLGEEQAIEKFRNHCDVSTQKTELATRVLHTQAPAVNSLRENDFCLYVGIPFCPTRCSYCSFVSQDMLHAKKLMEPYFALLLTELEYTAKVVKETGLSLRAVYIGGGTPTTLNPQQITILCDTIHTLFDFSCCTEFTIEAGRPDTIDREKLLAMKNAGVDRISINPQSLSNQVLENIGRRHTAQDVLDAFALAQEIGFDAINADLIVGLPGDDLPGFQKTLNGVIALGAENVTVHALALKRSAWLVAQGGDLSLHQKSEETAAMMEYSIRRLSEEGYLPYYLYRQSRMAGNLENTGWAKPGTICDYNIYTMDESVTVIACGAGGVSKIKDPYSGQLERIFNFKTAHEYIARHTEMLERKEGVRTYYEQFRQRVREVHQSSGADQ